MKVFIKYMTESVSLRLHDLLGSSACVSNLEYVIEKPGISISFESEIVMINKVIRNDILDKDVFFVVGDMDSTVGFTLNSYEYDIIELM